MSVEPKSSIAVIIPSRLQRADGSAESGDYFVERAMASVLGQGKIKDGSVEAHFIVGVDADAVVPERIASRPDTQIAHSAVRSQVGALNAGIELAGGRYDVVAFLEDDDRWDPQYLTWALVGLKHFEFLSSTQLEVDPFDEIIRINDFPTPSGWIMPLATLKRVGLFNPAMRWHLDNDWLGRLAEARVRRCHMVEVTAPVTVESSHQTRPWITNVLRNGGSAIEVKRHGSTTPLVIRTVHPGSGMAAIAANPIYHQQSQTEIQMLANRFGRVPW